MDGRRRTLAKMARTGQWKVPEPGIEDRLSSLPEEIIAHILSFLETKYAVGTAVLSRRWTDLWTRVSNLDFDNHLVYKKLNSYQGNDSPTQAAIRAWRDLEFSRFVGRVLSQHRNLHSVKRFRLHFIICLRNWRLRPDFLFEKEFLFGSQLEEIDVKVVGATECGSPSRIWWLPESFYTLKNLKDVKLNTVMMDANGWSVSLPSVEILQLRQVVFEEFETLSRLISGCPVLETLDLVDCEAFQCSENYKLIASLPSMRNLKICNSSGQDESLYHIAIEAPHLEHLLLIGFVNVHFLGSCPLPCLHSAQVVVDECRGSSYHCVMGLLTQISNAKEMNLAWATLEVLAGVDDVQFPVFPNLTHLTIEPCKSSSILLSLLHSASKLQALVIDLSMSGYPLNWGEFELACAPKCLLSSLEEIEIKKNAADEDDMKMVAYLLKAGVVLKKVDVHIVDEDTKGDHCKELRSLLKLPRESSACGVRLLVRGSKIDIKYRPWRDQH